MKGRSGGGDILLYMRISKALVPMKIKGNATSSRVQGKVQYKVARPKKLAIAEDKVGHISEFPRRAEGLLIDVKKLRVHPSNIAHTPRLQDLLCANRMSRR